MFRRIRKFAASPNGKRVVAWLAPIIVGWIVRKITEPKPATDGRKRVKNKAK